MDASALVAALEATWCAIQLRHPDVPDVFGFHGAQASRSTGGCTRCHTADPARNQFWVCTRSIRTYGPEHRGTLRVVIATIQGPLPIPRATAVDPRERCDRGQHLVKVYSKTGPQWTAMVSNALKRPEWDARQGISDIGLDLVATSRDHDVLRPATPGTVSNPNTRFREDNGPHFALDLLTPGTEAFAIIDGLAGPETLEQRN